MERQEGADLERSVNQLKLWVGHCVVLQRLTSVETGALALLVQAPAGAFASLD